MVTGKISGYDEIVYELGARKGQFLTVSLRPDNQSADFNLYIPGRGPGDEALFSSATGGREYTGQLFEDGVHSISVFLNRNAARKNETANFDIAFRITNKPPQGPISVDGNAGSMRTPAPEVPEASGAASVDAPARSPWENVVMAPSDHAPLLERQAALPPSLASSPVAIATLVVEKGLLGFVTEVTADYDTMEEPSEATVMVTESGILDDDLHGIRHVISLLRNSNNEWRITEYLRGELRRRHFR